MTFSIMPVILKEHDVETDISMLDDVWSEEASFALLPSRTTVSDAWVLSAFELLPEPMQWGHFALLTSGSTGAPKLIIGQKKRAERLVQQLHLVQESEPVKRTLVALPLSYSYAFVNQWLWARVMKRELIISPGFANLAETAKLLDGLSDAMLCLVGSQVPLMKTYLSGRVFDGVVRLHFAGGPFPGKYIKEIKAFFPQAKIFNNYGCAEAMPRLTLRPQEYSEEAANVGWPLEGIEMRINKERHVEFRSPYRAVAFFSDEGLKVLRDDEWIASGDLGELQDDGTWCILGRSNEVFKRFGEKISLNQLLQSVQTVYGGQAIFFTETDARGEPGHVLVLSPDPEPSELRGILKVFRKNHPRTHWPLRIESVSALPTLANGKYDILTLKNMPDKIILWRQRL